MNRSQYTALPAVNWSTLKALRESPAAYRWAVEHPRADTAALAFGRAVHAAILTPFLFDEDFAVFDGRRDTRTAAYQDFLAGAEGKTVLSRDQWDECEAVAAAVRGHPLAAPYLVEGRAEETVTWIDRETGIPCKGIVDWRAEVRGQRVLLDLKTTVSAEARRFGSLAARFGYHGQLAFYADGLAERGWTPDRVVILAVEKVPPHDCAVFVLTDDAALYAGREEYRALLRRLVECRAADRWPGRYEAERALELPAWMFADPTDADDLGITIEED